MTLENRELFNRDPLLTPIPNDGVAKVGQPESEDEWEVLRWELASFVCDGQYEQGLDRILKSFLTQLRHPTQPAAWVSGFYGSGKSHLVRVLEYLWRNVDLPDGTKARDLVNLTDRIGDQLIELSTAGRRAGGLWSAAGTLAAGRSEAVRLAFLSVLFESAGLPAGYPQARFTIWARANGYMETIEAALAAAGRSYEKEIHDLYVSPVIAGALLEADPTLADSVGAVRDRLQAQFPPAVNDVSDEEMFDAMESVLRLQSSDGGELPLTLIVLDEMQQYIGEDTGKALTVQNIVEGCSARFQSRVLFVATGQSALTVGGTLQRLMDRFTVSVVLSDEDVETVVRKVVLQKKSEHAKVLQEKLDSVAGEIDRQLGGTLYAPRGEDKAKLAPDYPVLPNRWRLWSEMLRAVDQGGKSGLVRSQLSLIHGGAGKVAEQPIGHVIGADYLFFDEKSHIDLVTSGVLLREVDDDIRALVAEGGDGETKGRICALIFLLSQMSDSALGGESGLRPIAAHIADLMVEDLATDGAELRRRVPELLEQLVAKGRLVQVDDEYRLLTREDAEWSRDYSVHLATIRDDTAQILRLRGERLDDVVEQALAPVRRRLTQGRSNANRKLATSWEQEPPGSDEGAVPVWVRDEWSVPLSAVERQAREAGDEDPTVFVWLPKHEPDRVKELLASRAAAEETLRRATPQTAEGRAAQAAMRTRLETFERQLDSLFGELVAHARVFQGGGIDITVSNLGDAVQTAAGRSLLRLFPKFDLADDLAWSKVIERARSGAPDALAAVGHEAPPTTNQVCLAVLGAVGAGGVQGNELHKLFGAPPYGWSKDAVNGAVLVLLGTGNLRAAANGKDLGPRELPPTQIGKATFYKEDEPPSVSERLAVKRLLGDAGVRYTEDELGAAVPGLLQRLKDLADRAGGPPPLPERPPTDHLDDLQLLGGNRQFKAVADAHERLAAEQKAWSKAAASREKREEAWDRLERLARHAHDLPVHASLEAAIAGIREGRLLLQADPDPLEPPTTEVEAALRARLGELASELTETQRAELARLEASGSWSRLEAADREMILAECGLVAEAEPVPSGDLLEALDLQSLAAWSERIELIPMRVDKARYRAADKLAPESVKVEAPRGVVRSEQELDELLADFRRRVEQHLQEGKTVII
jgi:hypothetical protein